MSVIEARTITVYVAANVAKGRRRKQRHLKRLAYRDAAWAKLRARCRCVLPDRFDPDDHRERKLCRYHDKEYRAEDVPSASYEEEGWYGFIAPVEWGLPRREEPNFWDYGRAVAFRLARFYAHLDSRPPASEAGGGETEGTR